MKRLLLILTVTSLLCGMLATSSMATPSTLIWIPSTDIQPTGVLHLGNDVYTGNGTLPLYDQGLTFGSGKAEYGIDYMKFTAPTGDGNREAWWFNGKYALAEESKTMPKLVIGAYNVGKSADASPNFIYALGSKTTKFARFHAGIATGNRKALLVDQTQVLLGIDKQLNSKWWAAADYQSGKSAFGALSAGVSYNFTPKTAVIFGFDCYNDKNLKDTLTIQVDTNF